MQLCVCLMTHHQRPHPVASLEQQCVSIVTGTDWVVMFCVMMVTLSAAGCVADGPLCTFNICEAEWTKSTSWMAVRAFPCPIRADCGGDNYPLWVCVWVCQPQSCVWRRWAEWQMEEEHLLCAHVLRPRKDKNWIYGENLATQSRPALESRDGDLLPVVQLWSVFERATHLRVRAIPLCFERSATNRILHEGWGSQCSKLVVLVEPLAGSAFTFQKLVGSNQYLSVFQM